jgi:3-isopropylmalate dehydrogenase
MRLEIVVLPGDGIGPEVTREAVRILRTVLDTYGYEFHCDERPIGGAAIKQFGTPLPKCTLQACMESHAVLLGAVGGPEFDTLPATQRPEAGLLALRRALGGYANLRPAIAYPSIAECSPLRAEILRGADILIVRELLGGIYFGDPRGLNGGSVPRAFNTMAYTSDEIERVARVAFREARRRGRKVTSVDKANVLETSQLWRQVVTRVGREFPDVRLEHMYVDTCAMRLVTNPAHFDVILTENLFGDILSDEAGIVAGSLGLLPSASLGGGPALYEPVHGSAPTLAGHGVANPTGAILSVAMMLEYTLARPDLARAVEAAVAATLREVRTPDIGGKARTAEFTAAVLRNLSWARWSDGDGDEGASEWAV